MDPWSRFQKEDLPTHNNFGEPAEYAARIDGILFDKEFTCEEMLLDQSLASDNKTYLSDHFPVQRPLRQDQNLKRPNLGS